jgi:hypothetical protein
VLIVRHLLPCIGVVFRADHAVRLVEQPPVPAAWMVVKHRNHLQLGIIGPVLCVQLVGILLLFVVGVCVCFASI